MDFFKIRGWPDLGLFKIGGNVNLVVFFKNHFLLEILIKLY